MGEEFWKTVGVLYLMGRIGGLMQKYGIRENEMNDNANEKMDRNK